MTADEALALVESVLNGERLNDVQELIFKQCWEGRCSYQEIAKLSKYDDEYIKVIAGKLWKKFSDAFDEKVKKNNLQSVFHRYLRRKEITLHRTQSIKVNLSGANLTGATLNLASLTGTRLLLTNFSESAACQEDVNQLLPDSLEEVIETENINHQEIKSPLSEKNYHWKNLCFCSLEQVEIAVALDRANILFFPNSQVRLTTPTGRENKTPDFLIFYQGKWGILEIKYPHENKDEELIRHLASAGICTIYYCDAHRCREEADQVVQEFLEILNQG